MLKNKSVMVIGGSSGIGFAVAQAASEEGANVTIVSRSEEKLLRAKEKINGNVKITSLDINDEEAVKSFFETHGNIDHLVMTAGSPHFCGIKDMTITEARTDFDNLFWRTYTVAKYALNKINANGSMVFTTGVIAAKPFKNTTVLSAATNAIEGFAKALAIDIAPVRVNVLSPGFTKTPLLGDKPEKTYAEMIDKFLIKRIADPTEMAHTVMYLLNNEYITGQVLRVEGGLLLS